MVDEEAGDGLDDDDGCPVLLIDSIVFPQLEMAGVRLKMSTER